MLLSGQIGSEILFFPMAIYFQKTPDLTKFSKRTYPIDQHFVVEHEITSFSDIYESFEEKDRML